MSVARHLGIRITEYDRLIRTFIPRYDAIIEAAADTVAAALAARRRRTEASTILDLGIGSGALSAACVERVPRAQVIGVDEDAEMLALAHRRIPERLTSLNANFVRAPFPVVDAIVASFALHHIADPRTKRAVYRKAFRALRPGGVMAIGDCFPSRHPALQARDRAAWRRHLERAYSPQRAIGLLRAWGGEDTYFPLESESQWLRLAGFHVDIAWRRGTFAVLAAFK